MPQATKPADRPTTDAKSAKKQPSGQVPDDNKRDDTVELVNQILESKDDDCGCG